jgi:hypothetical protein
MEQSDESKPFAGAERNDSYHYENQHHVRRKSARLQEGPGLTLHSAEKVCISGDLNGNADL